MVARAACPLDESASSLSAMLRAGELTVTDLTELALERIAVRDGRLHSLLTVDRDGALDAAKRLDRELADGAPIGPLFGLPVTLKDLFETKGLRTTSGSAILRDHVPAEDCGHAARVRRAGAVIVGKTNTPEFAIFIRTRNRLGPETANPWDLGRSCGGSSGGAAASVAAGLTPLAVASDGGGSTRIPAALCGVVGVQPSRGVVPRTGGQVGTLLFSSAGPIARTVADAALLLEVLAGPDERDPASLPTAPAGLTGLAAELSRPGSAAGLGLRANWVERSGLFDASGPILACCRRVLDRLDEDGLAVGESGDGLRSDRWSEAFYDMMMADRYATGGARFYEDEANRAQLSDYARSHFERAARITGARYSRALALRFHAIRELDRLFAGADVLLTPTVGATAPMLDAEPLPPAEARLPFVAYTFPVNYTGFAAVTVPCGLVDGLPVGMQVIARPGDEAVALRVARAIEALAEPLRPPIEWD
jgi:Asp-tRNA(Asn)/Glu-tRNA(Gln) amidotransferase A subunit family amidase